MITAAGPLEDVSPEAMTRAIGDNLFSVFLDLFSSVPGTEIFTAGETFGLFTGIAFPLFNGTARPRLNPDEADEIIEMFIAHSRARHVPMLWSLTPDSRPDDLGLRLEAHGFQRGDDEPGMALDLATLEREDPPLGVTVETVRDPAIVRLWAALCLRSFSMPGWLEEPLTDMLTHIGVGDSAAWQSYLALVDGEPAGVAAVYYGAGVAGIYNVGTLEGFRDRGVGRAITLAPLLDARECGYRVAILQSSRMGFPVYRRLGFRQYCEISRYVWSEDSPE